MSNAEITKKLDGTELLRSLCCAFGPSGYEKEVTKLIAEQLGGDADELKFDRTGNLYAVIHSESTDSDARPIMIAAHTDEVGFIVNDIDSDGYIHFLALGDIDAHALCGRRAMFESYSSGERTESVIASKAIHHQTAEERKAVTPIKNMYADIGASSAEDANKYIALGDYGVFISGFRLFGDDDAYVKSKALDSRIGCAVLIEAIRNIKKTGHKPKNELIFAFTARGKLGLSAARIAANRVGASVCLAVGYTECADLPKVEARSRVAELGCGAVLKYLDRSAISHKQNVDKLTELSKEKNIPFQLIRTVPAGTDSGLLRRSAYGAELFTVDCPVRYPRSATTVARLSDIDAVKDLLCAFTDTL